MKELIKVVNYGKNGVYLYSAIIKTGGKYHWTESKLCKHIADKHKIDWLNMPVQRELNTYSLNHYNLIP